MHPNAFHESLLESCAALKSEDNVLHNVHAMLEYPPELAHLCNAAISNDTLNEIINLIAYLVAFDAGWTYFSRKEKRQ